MTFTSIEGVREHPDLLRSSAFSVNVFTTFCSELEAIWRSLEDECDHFGFQCYDWMSHWQRTIGSGARVMRPYIAVAKHAATAVALFPFGLRRVLGVRSLEFLGGEQPDYNAPLIHPAFADVPVLATIWGRVLEELPRHDIRTLSRLPDRLNHGSNPALSIWPARASHRAYAASLSGTWDEYQGQIPKRVRSDSRRQLRRLAAHGDVSFVVASDGQEFDDFVTMMIGQKRRRFAETGARDILADESTQVFYRGLRGRLGRNGSVHLSALCVDGTVVATHWGMVYDDRFYYLMPTFAGGIWKTMSVGRLLQERLMQLALEKGLRCFDFSVGDEPYKRIWCNREMILYESVKVRSLRGLLFYTVMRLQSWAKSNRTTRRALMTLLQIVRKMRQAAA